MNAELLILGIALVFVGSAGLIAIWSDRHAR